MYACADPSSPFRCSATSRHSVLLISAASVYTANVLAALEYLPLDKLPSFDLTSTFTLGDKHQHLIEALQT